VSRHNFGRIIFVKARLARNPVIQETGAPRREIYRGGGLTDKFNRTRVRLSILVISSEAEKSHSILLKRTVRDVSVRARRGTSPSNWRTGLAYSLDPPLDGFAMANRTVGIAHQLLLVR
jgi:hypothetical protein